MSEPRQSLDALFARFALEQDEWDVWVEGWFDVAFMRQFVSALGFSGVSVLPVDRVELPPHATEELARTGEDNNRGRLLALARAMESEFGSAAIPFVAVVDRDLEVFRQYQALGLPASVFMTDGCSIEQVLWNPRILDTVAHTYLGIQKVDIDKVMTSLLPVLEDVFLAKAAQHTLELGCSLQNWRRLVVANDDGTVAFDRESYVDRLLDSNARRGRRDDLEELIEDLRHADRTIDGALIPGHEFFALLGMALRPLVPASTKSLIGSDGAGLARAALVALDYESAAAESALLGAIASRLQTGLPPGWLMFSIRGVCLGKDGHHGKALPAGVPCRRGADRPSGRHRVLAVG